MKTNKVKNNNKITSYFKVAYRKERNNVDKMESSNIISCFESTKTTKTSHIEAKVCETVGDSDSDDCFIIENEITVINIEEDSFEKRSDVENNLDSSKSSKTPDSKEPCTTFEDSNDYDSIMSSQVVEEIPEDDLDASLVSLEDDDSTVILSLETIDKQIETCGYQKANVLGKNKGETLVKFLDSTRTKSRKRAVIKRDYMTKFMSRMVKQFIATKELHRLFEEDDLKIIKMYNNLKSIGAQVLFSRMYWLKSGYKSTTKMVEKYLQVNFKCKAVRDMIDCLRKAHLLDDSKMELETWCDLQTRESLIKCFKAALKHLKLGSMGKGEIIAAIKGACQPKNDIARHFIQLSRDTQGTAVKQMIEKFCRNNDFIKVHSRGKEVFDRLHLLMYIGVNPQILRDKKLNLLLLNVKRNLQHYPAMDVKRDPVSCLFPSREHFERYINASQRFEEICDKNNVCVKSAARECWNEVLGLLRDETFLQYKPLEWHHRFSPVYIYYKAIEQCVPAMRSNHLDCDEAVVMLEAMVAEQNFRVHKKALWYTELVQCFLKMKQYNKAAEVLETALQNPNLLLDDKAPLCDKAQRLAQMKSAKLKIATRDRLLELSHQVYPDIPHITVCGKMLDREPNLNKRVKYRMFDEASGSTMFGFVEDLAIRHYTTKLGFTHGEHWESTIVTSIFALAFWDIIYQEMPGKGVFVSPFQEVPLDMFTSAFYENRKHEIDERLNKIKSVNIHDTLETMKSFYEARKPGDFSLYNDKISWSTLHDVVKCLGSSGLHAISKRLSHSYYRTHSGFPDITLWNADTNKIKFVEVKSHNDRLSFKQIQWMQYMIENHIDTEVCFVSPNETDINVNAKINRQSSASIKEAVLKKEEKRSEKKGKGKKVAAEEHRVDSLMAAMDGDVKPKRQTRTRNKNLKAGEMLDQSDDVSCKRKSNQTLEKSRKKAKVEKSCNKTPPKSPVKNINEVEQNSSHVYLRSPTKFSKGVGYFVSPTKSQYSPNGESRSPYKNLSPRRKLSLSLTRRRLTDLDK